MNESQFGGVTLAQNEKTSVIFVGTRNPTSGSGSNSTLIWFSTFEGPGDSSLTCAWINAPVPGSTQAST